MHGSTLHHLPIGLDVIELPEPGSVDDIHRLVRWREGFRADMAVYGLDKDRADADALFEGQLRRSLASATTRHLRALLSTGAVRDPAAQALIAVVLTERAARPLVPAPLPALLGLVAAVGALVLVVYAPALAVQAAGTLIDLVLR